VITDLDTHNHEWMRDEMADVWLGFERSQMHLWLEQAGLVNTIVDCTGESCCAESDRETTPDEQRMAQISVFVAVGTKRVSGHRPQCGALWRNRRAGRKLLQSSDRRIIQLLRRRYRPHLIGFSFRCRNASRHRLYAAGAGRNPCRSSGDLARLWQPTAFASMQPGQVVLDIGSGGGIDVFLASQKVGPTGKAIAWI